MASRFRRPLAALLLAAATAVAAVLPPAHIHVAEHDEHDHDHHAGAVEHAHWNGHYATRASLDDDDHGRVMFVDHPALTSHPDTTVARPATAVIALLTLAAPATFTVAERPTSGNSPRDGPARGPTLLRAPPAFVTL